MLVNHTRLGMLIRAGASNRTMIGALGIDIKTLFAAVFALGAALAGLAGMLISPITEASIGMGNEIIITAFVVIIVGGIGSMKGAFVAAILIGLIDTMGRSYLDDLLQARDAGRVCRNGCSSCLCNADLHHDGVHFGAQAAGSVPTQDAVTGWPRAKQIDTDTGDQYVAADERDTCRSGPSQRIDDLFWCWLALVVVPPIAFMSRRKVLARHCNTSRDPVHRCCEPQPGPWAMVA